MPAFTPKTTTSLSGKNVLTAVAVVLAAAAPAAGCDGGPAIECPANATRTNESVVECRLNGGVQVASSTLPLPATAVPGVGATSCLAPDSTCSNEAVISFASPGTPGHGSIQFGLRIAPGDTPGTYPLAGDTHRFSFPVVTDGVSYTGDLAVTSGNLVITQNNARNVDATFEVELQTTDGQHQVSLTAGAIHLSACRVVTRTVCVTAN